MLIHIYFVITSIRIAASLFEDQIGKFDWRKQYLGKITFGTISGDATAFSYKRLFLATEENVLSSISSETGEIIWRQIFSNKGRIDNILLRTDDISIVHGDTSKTLHNFDSLRGTLNWEWSFNSEKCLKKPHFIDAGDKLVLLAVCDRLFGFENSGDLLWSLVLQSAENVFSYNYFVNDKSAEIVVVGKTAANSFTVWRINAKHGNVLKEQPFISEYKLDRCLLLDENLFCLDSDVGIISSGLINDDGLTMAPVFTVENGIRDMLKVGTNAFVIVDKKSNSRVFSVNDQKQLHEISSKMIENVVDVKTSSFDKKHYVVFATRDPSTSQRAIHWLDPDTGLGITTANSIIESNEVYGIEQIFPVVYSKAGSGNLIHRTIVTGLDHSVALFEHNSSKPVWIRQEVLSQIVSVEMLDLPLSESQASVESEFSTTGQNLISMFTRRLTTQARQIQRGFLRMLNESVVLLGALGSSRSSEDWLTIAKSVSSPASSKESESVPFERDYFNLHKIIVVVTGIGKVFGLDSRNGKILWQLYDPEVMPFSPSKKIKFPLFIQRTTAHFPYPAQCVLVGRQKKTGHAYVLIFDPAHGQVKQSFSLSKPIKQAALLPVATEDELFGIAFLADNDEVFIYPSTIENSLSKWTKEKPIFFFNVDSSNGSTAGYRLGRQRSVDPSRGLLVWSAENVWRLVLSLEKGGKLIDIKTKRFNEHVHSQGRVLGDRSVLYKYSNPNLVAATVEKIDEGGKISYTVYLFDAVSGVVIFSLTHRRVSPPFHLVHCENWLVYTYYNEKSRRTEFTVLELYEGKHQTDPDKFSSFVARPPPIVMRQSYVFPQGVSALAVTDTEKGITSRHLIVALPFGGLLELHKAFLDPRRVLMPSAEEREEGLIPYMPDLPIATEHLINYNQSIFNVRDIHTSMAGLESTSLVLVYGLDMFYTRVHPSATFDILKDDFDHWFISLMLLGLFLASVFTKRLAKLRDLKLAWK